MPKIVKLKPPYRVTEPGAYILPAEAYHQGVCPDAGLSQSIAKTIIAQSPWHAWVAHPRLNQNFVRVEEGKFDLGTAAHTLLCGEGRGVQVCSYPDWRTHQAQQVREMIRAEGRVPMLAHHYDRTMEMVGMAKEQLTDFKLGDLFTKEAGHSEIMIAWVEGTCWFHILLDYLSKDFLTVADYKSKNESVSPHRVARIIHNDGWDIQAAMAERGLDAWDPDNAGRRRYIFAAQETSPPFALVPYKMTEAHMTMGRKKLQYAADKWAHAMQTGMWEGYCDGLVEPRLAEWSEKEWLEREIGEFETPAPRRGGRTIMEAG